MSYAMKVHDQSVMEGFPGAVKLYGGVANEEELERKFVGRGESKEQRPQVGSKSEECGNASRPLWTRTGAAKQSKESELLEIRDETRERNRL